MNKREFLEESGFNKPVVGMIIIGSFFGVFADIPLIIFSDSLLNINLGGALIPVIICGALIYRKKMNPLWVMFGTVVISVLAYLVSRIEPGVGIVAEFPYYFLPAAGALIISILFGLLLKKDETFQIPYAYTVGVLGTLIGADFLRIPDLLEMGVLGSFGGAGAMDLVYLSGLIAVVPLIFVYYIRHDHSPPRDPLLRAERYLKRGEYANSKKQILQGVQKEISRAYKLLSRNIDPLFLEPPSTSSDVLRCLGLSPAVVKDYRTLTQTRGGTDLIETKKDFLTARLLRSSIKNRLSNVYTSFLRRFLAYLLDMIVMGIPFVIFFIYMSSSAVSPGSQMVISEPVSLAVISLGVSIQFIYFTLTEWYFGTSLGKAVVGLKVLDDDLGRITFVQSAARNSGRYADIFLGFYILSLILILRSPEKKRIGDYIADTRVVKTK
ncbi:MAG: DUF1614 domain-containing protein [Candidatus Thermoplasmatota archaeon]|nr:DUF1614 domain-containing protein [Candidatus Thermoplasmatota archaeon]MBS3790384.1 DUF1614 domain-containing protein [Candidatus Thermoplasmatota archaeon]